MSKRPLRLTALQMRLIGAVIAAVLVAAGVVTADPGGSPTAPPARSIAAAPSEATAPPLAGTDHQGLAEPGDREIGRAPDQRGTPGLAGCVSAFNQHNYSSRNGARVQLLVAHYTVSVNTAGWSDVDANADWLDRSSTQASTGAIIDDEGHCKYTVPHPLKAWTQAAFNPVSFAIEFVDRGTEGGLSPAAVAKGALVFSQVARVYGIPARRGAVSGCAVTRSGIVDHAQLGQCGGGHTDIRPFSLDPLISAVARAGITATDRLTCRKLNWWRAAGRPAGRAAANAVRRRRALEARGVLCLPSGPALTE